VKLALVEIQQQLRRIKKYLIATLLIVVSLIIIRQARTIAWNDVFAALRAYHASTLIQSSLLCLVAYVLYGCFDLIGVRYIDADVSTPRVLGIGFVAYAINQSFGSLLGTVGIRLRFYGAQGLGNVPISKLIGLAIVSNWVGYLLVAGALFSARIVRLPTTWRISDAALQTVGIVMLLLVVAYVALCKFSSRRSISIRSETITLPSTGLALAQLLVGAVHWFSIAGMLYLLMLRQVDYVSVLGAFMLTSVSVLVAHMPAGLGVLEAAFVSLLSARMPVPKLMAALLAFRGIFYIGALAIAGFIYLLLESRSSSAKPAIEHPTS
jgi:uncharacterized membrane protein YbhN (UPF0104 family)